MVEQNGGYFGHKIATLQLPCIFKALKCRVYGVLKRVAPNIGANFID